MCEILHTPLKDQNNFSCVSGQAHPRVLASPTTKNYERDVARRQCSFPQRGGWKWQTGTRHALIWQHSRCFLTNLSSLEWTSGNFSMSLALSQKPFWNVISISSIVQPSFLSNREKAST